MESSKHDVDYDHFMSPSRYVKRVAPDDIISYHVQKSNTLSEVSRGRVKGDFNIKYVKPDYPHGATNPGVDLIYPSSNLDPSSVKKLLVFVHGGYWQDCHKDMYTFVGETFASLGYVAAIVGYNLAPKVKVEEIVEECQAAVAFAIKTVKPDSVFLSGWSAGGQIVAMLLGSNWKQFDIDTMIFKGVTTLSGVFDLRPLVSTYINKPLDLTEVSAGELSPLLNINKIKMTSASCRFFCLYAEFESPFLKRQSEEFSLALKEAGLVSLAQQMDGMDHFEIVEELANPSGSLVQAVENFQQKCVKQNQ